MNSYKKGKLIFNLETGCNYCSMLYCTCRLPRIGERLLVELDSLLNNRTEYKSVEKTLRKSLTNETKNAIRITIDGGRAVRSLANQLGVYLSVIDELLQVCQ